MTFNSLECLRCVMSEATSMCVVDYLHGLVMLPLLGRITVEVLDPSVCCA